MFEKEAEDYALVSLPDGYTKINHQKRVDFQKGAEFGYKEGIKTLDDMTRAFNREHKKYTDLRIANEWHFVKDGDLPKISDSTIRTLKPVFVAVVNGIETSTYGTYWNVHTGKFECLDKVYAWCDSPEPPELPKES